MRNTRYWVCAHVPLQNGKPFPRNEPFIWKGCGYVPGVTGKATQSVLCALIDAPGIMEVEQAVRDRFGPETHFVFVSPKPDGWSPPEFRMTA